MADLKFVGVNFEGTGLGPVNRVQSQADPSTDRLLIDTIAVSGGVSSPLSVIPLSPVPSSSSALSVSDGSGTVFSVLGDGTLASFGDWINGTNLSYSSGILLDPQGAPTYGVDGSVRILIGSGSNPTVSGTNGSINPPAGSLLLQTNGTAWIKTAAGATSWTQLGSGGGSDLDSVINFAAPDNDVNIPVGNPLVFRDGGDGSFNILSLRRTGVGSATALYIEDDGNQTGPAINIYDSSATTGLALYAVDPADPQYALVSSPSGLRISPVQNASPSRNVEILGGSITGSGPAGSVTLRGGGSSALMVPGAPVIIEGGSAAGINSAGGGVFIDGGDSTASTPGEVYIQTNSHASGTGTVYIGNTTDYPTVNVEGRLSLTFESNFSSGIFINRDAASPTGTSATSLEIDHGPNMGGPAILIGNSSTNGAESLYILHLSTGGGDAVSVRTTTGGPSTEVFSLSSIGLARLAQPETVAAITYAQVLQLASSQAAPTLANAQIYISNGDPNTIISAQAGSLCIDTLNGDLYQNESVGVGTVWAAAGGGGGVPQRIQDADNDTYVDTDLAGGDSDTVTIAAPDHVDLVTPELRAQAATFYLLASETFYIQSGNGIAPAEIGRPLLLIAGNGTADDGVFGGGGGGNLSLTAGNGGAATTLGGGSGGTLSNVAGEGGWGNGTAPGGQGGTASLVGGVGGYDNLSSGGPGPGGDAIVRGGEGGFSDSSVVVAGGNVTFRGGSGSSSTVATHGGDGGSATIQGGSPGFGTLGEGDGGNVVIRGGHSSVEGNGGLVTITGGSGGDAAGGTGPGTPGGISITGGTGGAADGSNPGSAGSSVLVQAGTGGSGSGSQIPGVGGTLELRGGDGGLVLSPGAPAGGNVLIQGGAGGGFSGVSGSVVIEAGPGPANGNITLGAAGTTDGISLEAQVNITFDANGATAPIPFNDGVDTDLVGFTSTSIIGALNELKASPGISDHGLLSGLADDDHTQYLLVNGTRNMSGRLVLIDGTAATPAIAFASNTNTGFYRSAVNTIDISLAGVQRGSITASLVSFDGAVQSASNASFRGTNGGSGTPTFTFTSDTDTGVYHYNFDVVGIACGGNASYRFANGTLTFNSNQLLTTTGTLSLTSTGAMSLDAGATDITFDARSMSAPITLNQSGNTDLVGFTATSIVGALNELKSGSLDRVTLNAATTITAGDVVIVNGSGTVDLADADNGDQFVAGIALTGNTIGNPVVVLLSGLVSGLSGLTAGTRYYLSTTAGAMTSTAPVGSGDLVIELGFAVSATQFVLRIQEGVVIP